MGVRLEDQLVDAKDLAARATAEKLAAEHRAGVLKLAAEPVTTIIEIIKRIEVPARIQDPVARKAGGVVELKVGDVAPFAGGLLDPLRLAQYGKCEGTLKETQGLLAKARTDLEISHKDERRARARAKAWRNRGLVALVAGFGIGYAVGR